jgi:uncharacterized protein
MATHARQCILALLLAARPIAAQVPDGRWDGAIHVMGSALIIHVTLSGGADTPRGTIDIPQQLARGLSLTNVRWQPPVVYFELPAGPGLAVFEGKIEGDTVRGSFRQAGIWGTFELARSSVTPVPVQAASPDSAVPYAREEVNFANGNVRLAGTLTTPPGTGPHPALLLITGSGPQNRDEEIAGFRLFWIIADFLTRKGIAVLRYDDRGVGGSTGNTTGSTTEDFAGDALAGVAFLRLRKDIGPIGLCGHSEGGIIAPMVALRSRDVAFIVLMAGTSVTGEKVLLDQVESLARSGGATPEQIARQMDLQRRVLRAVTSGRGWDTVERDVAQALAADLAAKPPALRSGIDSAEFIRERTKAQLAAARTPWLTFFSRYDPAPALQKVTCPVLALFGGRDMQVTESLNRVPLEGAMRAGGNRDWEVKVFPTANHLFQDAQTGSPREYATLPKEFVKGFLEAMAGWIGQRTGVR